MADAAVQYIDLCPVVLAPTTRQALRAFAALLPTPQTRVQFDHRTWAHLAYLTSDALRRAMRQALRATVLGREVRPVPGQPNLPNVYWLPAFVSEEGTGPLARVPHVLRLEASHMRHRAVQQHVTALCHLHAGRQMRARAGPRPAISATLEG